MVFDRSNREVVDFKRITPIILYGYDKFYYHKHLYSYRGGPLPAKRSAICPLERINRAMAYWQQNDTVSVRYREFNPVATILHGDQK